MTHSPDRQDAALGWIVRTNDPEFDAWDAFTAWLEEDAANADAYHQLAQDELLLAPMIETLASPVAERRTAPRRAPLAIAAGVAILAAAAVTVAPRFMAVDYSTGPGEIRTVALGGQDELVMNGETRLSLAGFDRRTVRIEQGQILLRLRDSQQEQVEVLSGDLRLVDVGTVFEVARDDRETRVLVSEGAVMADPAGARLKIGPGQRLDTQDGATVLQATAADLSAVGSFERGQLVYLDEPIEHVLADLRRSTGIDFSTSAAIRTRRFSGTLSVAEVKRDPRSLQPLLGVSMERSDKGWKLGGRV